MCPVINEQKFQYTLVVRKYSYNFEGLFLLLNRAGKMTPQVKALASKPDNLSFIPGTHVVEENSPPEVVF